MIMQIKINSQLCLVQLALIFMLLLAFTPSLYAAESVGVVTFARGTVAAHNEGQKPRVLGKDADVFEGDNIQTSERSFIVITFNDNSKITVRPNSSFSITQFTVSDKHAQFELHQGGVRTSSGEIADDAPENFQITTPDTTISAQQADFSVRVCQQHCQTEEDKLKKATTPYKREVIARIVDVEGLVEAVNNDILAEDPRPLAVGAPLYSADTLTSHADAYAVLVFKDKGRITIEAASSFAISSYHLNETDHGDKAFYDLISGGMRVLTGSIGKDNHDDYEITTAVATIGIRGTGFDLVERDRGLTSRVWQGTIAQTNESGTTELSAPNANFIKDQQSAPEPLTVLSETEFAELTPQLNSNDSAESSIKSHTRDLAPRPDRVSVLNEPELFEVFTLDRILPGTYVDVHDGHVQVRNTPNTTINLGRNESSYTDPKGHTIRIERPPEFMRQDPYPLPNGHFNESMAEISDYSLLADKVTLSADTTVYRCVCK